MRPVVALLTDFGTRDHYAGAMKGVVLGICPEAALVDISHDIPPHDILGAALELRAAVGAFPAGTVFLVVVDPGVGSSRRPLAAEAGGFRFVAPDNGVLTAVFRDRPPRCVVELTEPRFARGTVSRTFEGRDRFAPAAAWLARGVDLRSLGRAVADWTGIDIPAPIVTEGRIEGQVVRVDRFGNLVTNIERPAVEAMAGPRAALSIVAGGHPVPRLVSTYADVADGDVCALFGSGDELEIACNGGSAAERLALSRGAVVAVSR